MDPSARFDIATTLLFIVECHSFIDLSIYDSVIEDIGLVK